MREDMIKVITERGGRFRPNPKKFGGKVKLHPNPDYDYPKEFGGIQKNFCDYDDNGSYENTNIIKRILFKNLGRPWNTVYSEFCEILAPGYQRHWIDWLITIDTVIENGIIYVNKNRWSYRHEVSGFYVHPITGLLEYKQPVSKAERRKKWSNNAQKIIPVPDKPGWVYKKLNGLWFQMNELAESYKVNLYGRGFYESLREKHPFAGYELKSCNHKEIKYINEQLRK